jgi:hypothetical protein
VSWAAARGFRIVPHGVDLGEALIDRARERHVDRAGNFVAADAWQWQPGRRWTYVYSLLELAPTDLRCEWLRRLHGWVDAGGRLIIGSYGSRSRNLAPVDVAQIFGWCGFEVAGSATGVTGRSPDSSGSTSRGPTPPHPFLARRDRENKTRFHSFLSTMKRFNRS